MRLNMKRGFRLRTFAGLLLVAVLVIAFPVKAAWSVLSHSINILTVSSFQTRIEEEYTAPEHVSPSQTVEKRVYAKNTGSVDAIIRMKIRGAFGTTDEEGDFVEDPSLDPAWIHLQTDRTGIWKQMDDGYYYLTEVLRPGERSSVPLLTSFTLAEETPNVLKGKEGRIFVSLEGVQAGADAVSLWGKTREDLSVVYQEAVSGSAAKVRFEGQEAGFEFDVEETDLFRSFKYLTPGCGRVQTVILENHSPEECDFFLQALVQEQDIEDPREAELVRRLIREYAQITICQGEEVLYRGSVDGNPLGDKNREETMGTPLMLGRLAPEEETRLTVSLEVSPGMDNEYMDLAGKVHWVFYAAGDSGIEPGEMPYTGDDSPIGMMAVMWCIGIGTAAAVVILKKRTEDHS